MRPVTVSVPHVAAVCHTALPETLPPARRRLLGTPSFSHVLMMAFDGFVIGHHLRPGRPCSDGAVAAVCDLILGERPAAGAHAAVRRKSQLTLRAGKSK